MCKDVFAVFMYNLTNHLNNAHHNSIVHRFKIIGFLFYDDPTVGPLSIAKVS